MKVLGLNPKYHMIGHLQTNKVKYIADGIDLIHSLDSISLAEEIDKRGKKAGKVIEALIQVNVAGEDTKFGLDPNDLIKFIESVIAFKNLRIKGLMTIAPFVEDEIILRKTFNGLYELGEKVKARNYSDLDIEFLSMGMTNDFELAIAEGSNMIRVGTGIFGKRNY
jgi:pyridoxal phosphate enzyme (YggS family)